MVAIEKMVSIPGSSCLIVEMKMVIITGIRRRFANDTGVVNIADILVIFGILLEVGSVVVKGKW